MKKSKKKKKLIKLAILFTFIVAAFIPIKSFIWGQNSNTPPVTKKIDDKKEEINNKEEVNDKVEKTKAAEVKNNTVGKNTENNVAFSNDIDNKTFYKDGLFFGDSIIEGLSFYEVLDEQHVIHKKGLTAFKAKKEVPNIVKLNPKNIFILLGNNDLFNEKLKGDSFIQDYSGLLQDIKEGLPEANIYILSILPVADKAKKEHPFLSDERIEEFNMVLEDMAEKEGLPFINIEPVLNHSEELYEEDGIHFKAKFYDELLDYLKKYLTENENLQHN
ncbi:hypothetical protein KQI86_05010 [Clostridium sp. MSJ-11]|uniref:SGNH hydrolase-type esterase domain-containing protein n=1 Tax=Clostridium mobile TaxID=2841512 RepID=A0ABS6EF90_9CLOT|nr:GDSL-type esterase/lipase family protein [Clostridium mobile]MBU5483680.1 hypothetical protein [Clostridium mobile]